ncbi:S9 family peptidase [Phytomonospora endophytica]|uniref:Dipeptidyl aminopeptidase/acylaminoacyl peptidase n=1 Tax=Phytomonospora endophytica TaxID=714109 RepID=A0A841FWG4_9ACTN|nr:prolyl oligopeptidase family serine peptidase [Phytomonospora endophytica]MBB6037677.1 dipeptidyl aminopeptidase/acylaminoacyl peptidase [Phytomonospora endophytica]
MFWVESRPEQGVDVVATWTPQEVPTFTTIPVGNSIHAYGGGTYAVSPRGIWVVSSDDGRIWLDGGSAYTSPGSAGDLRFAGGLLLFVRETDTYDELVVIDPDSGGEVVLRTAGFIASPSLSDGRLAWVEWPVDVMPWDQAEVWVADLVQGQELKNPTLVAGGPTEAATQPQWGPDGTLYFMSDRGSGWQNLHRWDGAGIELLVPMEADCAEALWELGYSSYGFLPDGRIAMVAQNGVEHRLVLAEASGAVTPLATPYTFFKPYLAVYGDHVAVIGSSPTVPQQVALVATDGSGAIEVIRSGPEPATDAAVSAPQILRVDSDGVPITVVYYPPLSCVPGQAAPLIVRAHPGPTHHNELRLDAEIQFFTSRGFAVADVDYGGSTGYGRAFRKTLDHRWGELDVADCCNAAVGLIDLGLAEPGTIFITGASAGGYTALRAVSSPDTPFALAAARSAIVDPNRWVETAPRFQRPHAAILTHATAGVEADRVSRPVLLVHGDADMVAPAADVRELAEALKSRGMLAGYLPLADVGHYLSKPEALNAALSAELAAYEAVINRADPRG